MAKKSVKSELKWSEPLLEKLMLEMSHWAQKLKECTTAVWEVWLSFYHFTLITVFDLGSAMLLFIVAKTAQIQRKWNLIFTFSEYTSIPLGSLNPRLQACQKPCGSVHELNTQSVTYHHTWLANRSTRTFNITTKISETDPLTAWAPMVEL